MKYDYEKKYNVLMKALERSAMNNHISRHSHTDISAANWTQCKESSCVDALTALQMKLDVIGLGVND